MKKTQPIRSDICQETLKTLKTFALDVTKLCSVTTDGTSSMPQYPILQTTGRPTAVVAEMSLSFPTVSFVSRIYVLNPYTRYMSSKLLQKQSILFVVKDFWCGVVLCGVTKVG